jgi:hypothetical protein
VKGSLPQDEADFDVDWIEVNTLGQTAPEYPTILTSVALIVTARAIMFLMKRRALRP